MKFGSAILTTVGACWAVFSPELAQGSSDSLGRDLGGAVDAKGVHHHRAEYASNRVPWMPDYAIARIFL